jgi:uncharacterized protein (TIGR00251 family)
VREFKLHDGKQGAALTIRVTPRSRRAEIAGVLDNGTLRIRVPAPPVEGRANAALVEFVADVLEVRKSQVEIVAGHHGLDKIVSILDMPSAEVERKIIAWMRDHSDG